MGLSKLKILIDTLADLIMSTYFQIKEGASSDTAQ